MLCDYSLYKFTTLTVTHIVAGVTNPWV